jgi:dihydrolipoamide dehydrogenase
MERKVDVAIIGAGTAGLDAMSEVRKVTDNFVLIDGGELGTTCARVGCMPSKVMIQIADDFHRRQVLAGEGIQGGDGLTIDLEQALAYTRSLRDRFVDGIIEDLIMPLRDNFIEGYAEFVEPDLLKIEDMQIRAKKIVIAVGSKPVIPRQWRRFENRILTTDTIFEQHRLPQDIAVLGLGVIGLELGQALARMGLTVTGFDMLYHIGGLRDPEVNRIAVETIGKELPMHLGEPAEIEEAGDRLHVKSGNRSVPVDKVLLSLGRAPQVDGLRLDRIGISLDDRDLPIFNPRTMQIENLPIFIAGDASGFRPVLHEASHEGITAGYNAVHEPAIAFKRRTPLLITFSDPNICIVGASWEAVKNIDPVIGSARFRGGRVLIMNREGGMIRIYADRKNGRILGAEMAAPSGEHIAHLLSWSIQQERTVFDLLSMPYYHPVLEETLEEALSNLAEKVENGRQPLLGFKTS